MEILFLASVKNGRITRTKHLSCYNSNQRKIVKIKSSYINWLNRSHKLGLSNRTIIIFVSLSIVTTVSEIFGIGIFLPIFQFIRLNGDLDVLVADSSFWQYAIDWLSYFGIEISLSALLLLSFSFFISRQLFTYIRLIYNVTVTQKLVQLQRNYIFNGYIDADTSYHDRVTVGDLVNVVTTEVNGAVSAVMLPMGLIVYIVMLVFYLMLLFFLSWQMTLIAIIVLFFTSQIPSTWIKKSSQTGRKLVSANISMSEFLVRRLQSPRLVRLSGTETVEKNEFQNLTQRQRKHTVFAAILKSKTEVSMEPVVIGMSMVFLYFSYTLLQLQVEVMGLYLLIILRLLPVVKGIISQWQNIKSCLGSIEVIENRLKLMEEFIEPDVGIKFLHNFKRSIVFENVDYRYFSDNNYALKNISIEFKVNQMTAIVGPSGSGKSTLIDLLPGLRRPNNGLIKIDGENIQNYTLKSLRQLISYVPQTPQVFSGSVESHILLGKNNATNEEVMKAVQLSGSQDFINQLPEGLKTILGDGATNLSGGQRQKLDLARALVKKAPILILDEPISNLDIESEKIFNQTLNRIKKETNTTIIIVSHKLDGIMDADNIVVLNQGIVEAVGTHNVLLENKSWYSKAWNM